MIEGLEYLLYKERLRKLRLFSLKMGSKAQGNLPVFVTDRRE